MKKIWVILCLALISCGNGNNGNASKGKTDDKIQDFPHVEVPAYIQDRNEALSFLIRNFWKPYFRAAQKENSLYTLDSIKFEEAYGRYVQILNMAESGRRGRDKVSAERLYNTICSSQKQLFAIADSLYLANHKAPLGRLLMLSEKYLYDPNSPALNEELYIPALEAIMALESFDSTAKMQYKWQLELASMNRIGAKASNFEFEQKRNGKFKRGKLHDIDAEYLLLYFNNPDCNACRGQNGVLFSDPGFVKLFEDDKIKVLSMYIDEDTALWEKHQSDAPQSGNWIYAHDPHLTLRNNGLYGIRAIPSMYLLDKNKNVILKDATAEKVVQYLRQN